MLGQNPPLRSARKIYVVAHGQQDNIGDSILRRAMLAELREFGLLNIHTAKNDADFLSGLGLHQADVCYESSWRWLLAGVRDLVRGDVSAVSFNAGEAQLSARYVYHSVAAYGLAILARLSGVPVLQTGVGLKAGGRSMWLLPLRFALSGKRSVATWRDSLSAERATFGDVQPDWAFTQGATISELEHAIVRTVLAVSMRGDVRMPGETWFKAIRAMSRSCGLDIAVVAQVERDQDRAQTLAEKLEATTVVVFDSPNHAEHEVRVRDVYRRSALVVSDRLHALVVGLTEGAIPVAFSADYPEKAARTLRSAGVARMIARAEAAPDVLGLPELVAAELGARSEYLSNLATARKRIRSVVALLVPSMKTAVESPARPPATAIVTTSD